MRRHLIAAAAILATSSPLFAQTANIPIGVGIGLGTSRSNAIADGSSNARSNATSANRNANQSGAVNTNNFNSTTTGQSPSVFAPGMSAAGIESCNGSISLGGAAVGGGGALGFPWQDGPCNKRLNARTLWAFGQHEAAVQVLCQDDELATAMVASGIRCRVGQYAQAYATVSTRVGHPVYKAEFKHEYFDKAGHKFVVSSCTARGARKSADAGVCVVASN
jgi:hypothetical protein